MNKPVVLFAIAAVVGVGVIAGGIAAVEGTSQSTGNAGYLGSTTFGVQGVGNGSSNGVQGFSSSGRGVYGYSASNWGVRGESGGTSDSGGTGVTGASTNGVGVAGVSTSNYGVFGATSASAQNPYGIGVIGYAPNGGFGVYGAAPAPGWAGYFYGDVRVTNAIYQGAGAAQIDHPLDPANMVLSQPFVQSSEMKSIYDGVATLDEQGMAEVTLPDWCEALNGDFRYQLTPIGEHAPLYISKKIKDNSFQIAGGYAGMEVSWQVTGVRHDAYAKARPIDAESLKPIELRGRLLHPEAFGRGVAESFDRDRAIAVKNSMTATISNGVQRR